MAEVVGAHPAALAGPAPPWTIQVSRRLSDYLSLVKPGIMLLLVLTELATLVMASRGWPGSRLLLAGVVGGVCASGGASAFNCWYDCDLDRGMRRTAGRPLPAGRVPAWHALTLSIVLTGLSVLVLGFLGNWLAAFLSICGGIFYCLVYTVWLKRMTRYNIVIGGAAGCFPPLVGWALVTGSLSALPLLLGLIVLFWTPPHFWSLALLLNDDYARAGVPMLPVVIGPRRSVERIIAYCVLLVPLTLLPGIWLGPVYVAISLALGCLLGVLAILCRERPGRRSSAVLFAYSVAYLALLFTVGAVAAVIS
jgi:protoheme IX farnesyltransferase